MDDGAPLEHEGPLARADACGVSGSMECGPGVRVWLGLDGDVIASARFETCSLAPARPVAEAMCGILEGATIEDASRMTVLDVARAGGVPATSVAARTAHFAKSAALLPFLGRGARHGSSLTCICFQVRTDAIVETVRRHRIRTVEDLKRRLPAATGCGTCRPDVRRIIEAEADRDPASG